MAYTKYLKELKESRKLTSQEISTLSNIPLATVSKVLSGSTDNPTFETISKLVVAMGGSIDEMIGIKIPDDVPMTPQVDHTITAYADLLNEKDKLLAETEKRIEAKDARIAEHNETISILRETLKLERKERRKILGVSISLMTASFIFLMAFLVFDVFNGSIGFLRF